MDNQDKDLRQRIRKHPTNWTQELDIHTLHRKFTFQPAEVVEADVPDRNLLVSNNPVQFIENVIGKCNRNLSQMLYGDIADELWSIRIDLDEAMHNQDLSDISACLERLDRLIGVLGDMFEVRE